ncbi:MAG: hypothetical protein AAF702_26990 [Chloroflexota bacterium]
MAPIGVMSGVEVVILAAFALFWLGALTGLVVCLRNAVLSFPLKVGIVIAFLVLSLFGFPGFLLAVWILGMVHALTLLRKSTIEDSAKALWAVLVVAVPILGVIAFHIVKPCEGGANATTGNVHF